MFSSMKRKLGNLKKRITTIRKSSVNVEVA